MSLASAVGIVCRGRLDCNGGPWLCLARRGISSAPIFCVFAVAVDIPPQCIVCQPLPAMHPSSIAWLGGGFTAMFARLPKPFAVGDLGSL
jgi:hypothetical protein